MSHHAFPEAEQLARKRRIELFFRSLRPALGWALGGSVAAAGILAGFRLDQSGLVATLFFLSLVWLSASAKVLLSFLRHPAPRDVAKRADRVLELPDDLMALSEFPVSDHASPWHRAAWSRASQALASANAGWKPRMSRGDRVLLVAALTTTLLAAFLGQHQFTRISTDLAAQSAGREQRQQAAEEILQDWEEFAETTREPELEKLFAQASAIRDALKSDDPMEAMLEINRFESQIDSLMDSISSASMAPHADKIAEAMESFDGAGAMAAALRNANFEAAAREADKLAAAIQPEGSSNMRRGDATTELLANEATSAGRRGNQPLSQTLSRASQMAKSHASSSAVPNKQLKECASELSDHFRSEANRQACKMAASTGKSQLDALRASLRGEPREAGPSLCKGTGSQPGGFQAGSGTDGNPSSDPTELDPAAEAILASSTPGEGESEVTESRTSSGSAGTASAGTRAETPDYFELSRKAVADESLPLAHRRSIRTYFERIRPIANSQ